MDSPVDISFQSFIKIDRRKNEAVYMQIVYQFINAVKTKLLEDGDLLPGSRKIAEELTVHRKTIVAAMAELQEQGWIDIVPNIGSFVKNPKLATSKFSGVKAYPQPPYKAPYQYRKELVLDIPISETQENLYFTDGTPDYEIINIDELIRFYASVLKRKTNGTDGSLFFRDQLSYYLNISRGFHLSRSFLLPIASREKIFSILSRLLVNIGDVILVEELSYFLPNMIFSQAGAKLRTVPIDEDGMNIDFIRDRFKPGEIRCVYINTQCHYPTTVKLSEERKAQLLHLAELYNFIVIEDDVDFEFATVKHKAESLFRKDGGNRVIYIGAFGRFLNPGFQTNFIIAPKDLLDEGKKYLNIFGKSNIMLEKALGEIIHQGDIFRYQRKSQKIINGRKEMFAQLLNIHFKDYIFFKTPISGLAFWILFKDTFSLIRLQEKARENGLLIPAICLYQNRKITALRMGFAHLSQQDMEEAIFLLHKAYKEVIE